MSTSVENEAAPPNSLPSTAPKPAVGSAEEDSSFSAGLIRWLLIPGTLVLAACAAFYVDLPLARVCYSRDYPGFVRHILDNAEPFGDAYGLLLITLAIFLVDPPRRIVLPWTIAAGLGAGLAADVIKLLISRTRPQSFDLDVTDVAQTFNQWLPLTSVGSHDQSFPSAHTAVAVGFAVALCRFFPRGRYLFIAMAVMCGMHRVQTCAHFLSDAFIGAAVGWLVSHAILESKWCRQSTASLSS